MEDSHEDIRIFEIFNPHYIARRAEVQKPGNLFVHYTSSQAAMNIIQTRNLWLRNSYALNDFSEIEHGIECLRRTFNEDEAGKRFINLTRQHFPRLFEELSRRFEGWLPHFRTGTYIASFSEHYARENDLGRLSMWRAYGGRNPVALVLNKEPFFRETDAFHAYANPVDYLSTDEFPSRIEQLRIRIEKNLDYVIELGEDELMGWLFDIFRNVVVCSKHPGFEEEREWRVAYTPNFKRSKYILEQVECVCGIPQVVCKAPLIEIPEENFYGADIPSFIHRIIIGPHENQKITRDAFIDLLRSAGAQDAEKKVVSSGIPLK